MRNVSVLVDFTSGLNLYPGLRLCNNSDEYSRSIARMDAVLTKMSILVNASRATRDRTFSTDAIVAEHRFAEIGRSKRGYGPKTEPKSRCRQDTHAALALLMARFPAITLHLQTGETERFPSTLAQASSAVQAMGAPPNLRLALHAAQLTDEYRTADATLAAVLTAGVENASMRPGVLFVAAPALDEWDYGRPGQFDSRISAPPPPWKCVRTSGGREGCLRNVNHTWTGGHNKNYSGCLTCFCCEPEGDLPTPEPTGILNFHAPLQNYPTSQEAALLALLRIGRSTNDATRGKIPCSEKWKTFWMHHCRINLRG